MATSQQEVPPGVRAELESAVAAVRPQLLRYCARMTGSVADGEDVVQDALLKAVRALPSSGPIQDYGAWLFRIVHNQALDHLRRAGRLRSEPLEADPPAAETQSPLERREMATIALALFLRLTPLQRSAVFLKDVMGYSLEEIGGFHEASLPAVKAALHRGRSRLRELSRQAETPPPMDAAESAMLDAYVARFNARDFDALRAMLASDVRLNLVGHHQAEGAEKVGDYFSNYDRVQDWRAERGFVDRRPALLVYDPREPGASPTYFVLIEWRESRIARIRDFRYARHVMAEAEVRPV